MAEKTLEGKLVKEHNAYEAIDKGAFPGRWKRLHGIRGLPDYLTWVPKDKRKPVTRPERQFFVEVKQLSKRPTSRFTFFNLDLRPAQVPFFAPFKRGGWPGEKYVLVRWGDTKTWSWFSGEDRKTSLSREIPGPFKRD